MLQCVEWRCCDYWPFERHIGIKDGSCHGFCARIVTDRPKTDGGRLSAQTAALFLHISLHFHPGNKTYAQIVVLRRRGHNVKYQMVPVWCITCCNSCQRGSRWCWSQRAQWCWRCRSCCPAEWSSRRSAPCGSHSHSGSGPSGLRHSLHRRGWDCWAESLPQRLCLKRVNVLSKRRAMLTLLFWNLNKMTQMIQVLNSFKNIVHTYTLCFWKGQSPKNYNCQWQCQSVDKIVPKCANNKVSGGNGS